MTTMAFHSLALKSGGGRPLAGADGPAGQGISLSTPLLRSRCRRKTGQGNYGPSGLSHGARVIQLVQGESAALSATWIRLVDGQREQQGPSPLEAKAAGKQDVCGSGGPMWGSTGWQHLSSDELPGVLPSACAGRQG